VVVLYCCTPPLLIQAVDGLAHLDADLPASL